jgi:hypothetical protein
LTTALSGNDNHPLHHNFNDNTGASFMGGPIVRTGTTPAFWENWDKAFGKTTAKIKKEGLATIAKLAKKIEKMATGPVAGKTKKTAAAKPTARKPAQKSVKSAKSKPAGKPKKKKK